MPILPGKAASSFSLFIFQCRRKIAKAEMVGMAAGGAGMVSLPFHPGSVQCLEQMVAFSLTLEAYGGVINQFIEPHVLWR